MIIAANPSTLINLARAGDQEKESLIRDLHDGTLSPRFDVPADIRAELTAARCAATPSGPASWKRSSAAPARCIPKDYWPADCLLGNWTGGSVGAYLRHYPRYYGDHAGPRRGPDRQRGPHDHPAGRRHAGRRPRRDHALLRVHPRGGGRQPAADRAGRRTSCARARRTIILLTTAFGLYRYHIHDLVRVAGFHNGTPLIEFLSKGAHFANITGEKLSEYHVTQAMAEVLRELDLTLTAYSLAPCWPTTAHRRRPRISSSHITVCSSSTATCPTPRWGSAWRSDWTLGCGR